MKGRKEGEVIERQKEKRKKKRQRKNNGIRKI